MPLPALAAAAMGAVAAMSSGGKSETTQELLRAISADDSALEALTPLSDANEEAALRLLQRAVEEDHALSWVSGPENGGKHPDLVRFIVRWNLHVARSVGHCICVQEAGVMKGLALLLPPRVEESTSVRLRATMAVGLPPMDKDVRAWGRPAAVRFAAWHRARASMHGAAVPSATAKHGGAMPGAWAGPRQPHWRLMLLAVGDRDERGGLVPGPPEWRLRVSSLLLRAVAAAADRDGWMAFVECTGSPEHATLRMAAIITQFEVVRQRPLEGPGAEPFDTNGGLCAMIRRPHSERFQQPSVNGVGSSSTMQGEVEE